MATDVHRFDPTPQRLAYTFGGREPLLHLRPGDALELHFVEIIPARDRAVSATLPRIRALTSSYTAATLRPPPGGRIWWYDVDVKAGVVRNHAPR